MTVIEHKHGIRRMRINLDIEFSCWAKQGSRCRGGFNHFSEYIRYGARKKYLKYHLGENCKTILDSRWENCTWTKVQFLATAFGASRRAAMTCLEASFPLSSWSLCCSKIRSHSSLVRAGELAAPSLICLRKKAPPCFLPRARRSSSIPRRRRLPRMRDGPDTPRRTYRVRLIARKPWRQREKSSAGSTSW